LPDHYSPAVIAWEFLLKEEASMDEMNINVAFG
jgi:hypothetical protein